MSIFVCFVFFWGTGELSTHCQLVKVTNEPGLSPNNGRENAFLSDHSMASRMSTLCQLVLTKIPHIPNMCERPALSR